MAEVTIHSKYEPLWNADSRYFVVTGGRGSGKSFSVALFLLSLMFEKGQKVLYTRLTMSSAFTSIIPEFVDKLELLGVLDKFRVTRDEIRNIETGSSIIFKGIKTSSGNQTAALKSLQGVTVFVVEEAEELTDEATFDKIDLSVRSNEAQNRVILILNPTTRDHWIHKRFFTKLNKDDTETVIAEEGWNGTNDHATYIHTTYMDNEANLPKEFVEVVRKMKAEDPSKYEHTMLGGWLEKAEGVIYQNWRKGKFVETDTMCWGQDFGFSNTDPTTLVHVSVDRKERIIYAKEGYAKTGLTTSDVCRLNWSHAGTDIIVADNHEPRLITELKGYGLNVKPAHQPSGSILTGIALIQDYTLIIDPNSKKLIRELNNYAWKPNMVQPKPKGGYDHLLDAMRYAVFYLVGKKRGEYFIL